MCEWRKAWKSSWIRIRFFGISYNFSWHKIRPFVENPATRAIWLIPIFGYAVLFGDSVAEHLRFSEITGNSHFLLMDDLCRLQLLYMSFIILFVARTWFSVRAPFAARIAGSPAEYTRYALDNFSLMDFRDTYQACHARIQGTLTQYFEASDDDYAVFSNDFAGERSSSPGNNTASRAGAIDRNYDFLQSTLLEFFAQKTRVRKVELLFLWLVTFLGYLLLALPSLDLFQAVLRAMWTSNP